MVRTGGERWRRWARPWECWKVTWIRALVSPEPQLAAVAIAREAERVNRAADALEHAVACGAYAGRWMRRRSFWAQRWGWWGRDCPCWNGGRGDLPRPAGMTRLR